VKVLQWRTELLDSLQGLYLTLDKLGESAGEFEAAVRYMFLETVPNHPITAPPHTIRAKHGLVAYHPDASRFRTCRKRFGMLEEVDKHTASKGLQIESAMFLATLRVPGHLENHETRRTRKE
jgi:hypothetical protein